MEAARPPAAPAAAGSMCPADEALLCSSLTTPTTSRIAGQVRSKLATLRLWSRNNVQWSPTSPGP